MCLIALCLCAVIFLMLKIRPPSVLKDDGSFPKEAVLKGTVCDKYLKNGSFFLVLSKARFVKGSIPGKKEYKVIVKLADRKEEGSEICPAFLRYPGAGQECLVSGRIYIFEGSRNPGQFDMAGHERYKGVDFELTRSEVLKVSGRTDPVREGLFRLKHRLSLVYDSLADEDDAGILKAMILGDRNGLTDEMKDLYQRAGISHVLCISGLHISLLGCGMYLFLQGRLKRGRPSEKVFLTRLPAGIISMAFLILYGIMTGMGVSVKRAIIMFILMTIAEICGRTYDSLSALSLSSLILLLMNPLSIFDPAFVLSFTAVLGIGLIKPAADIFFPVSDEGPLGKLLEMLKVSLCVNIFSYPLTLVFFYRIPLYSVFLNLCLIPLMGVLLVFAVLTGITGLISLYPARPFAAVCRMILGLYEGVCRINDKLPFSLQVKGCPKIPEIIAYYLILTLIVLLAYMHKNGRIRPAAAFLKWGSVCLLAGAFILIPLKNYPKIEVIMLDIGQGDCIYIGTGTGKTVLIDCGSSDEDRIGKYKVIPFLRYKGKKEIDAAVMTHADKDHISGFEELLSLPEMESVPIRTLIMPDTALKDEAYRELEDLVRSKGVNIKYISTGNTFRIDDVMFTCLHPDRGYVCEDRNEYSTVLSVSCGSFRGLFTGDVEGRGEEIMTKRAGRGYTLLKCAHHGSDNSTPEAFVDRVRPEVTFISAGRENKYGHPGPETVRRLKAAHSLVFVTKDSGALSLVSDGREVRISKWLK